MSTKINNIYCFNKPLKSLITPIYEHYWRFSAERQNVFFKRYYNEKSPWTNDPIIQKFKFTNTYRASDRVSQYLIKEIIYNNEYRYGPEDTIFRILLFKIFNKIETWEYLQNKFGEISFKTYKYDNYDQALLEAITQNKKIYSAAYIMPSGRNAFGYLRKHQNNLRLLEKMMHDDITSQIESIKNMEQLYKLLLSYPSLGKFLAFQYCIDINYSEICNFSEMSFVVAGPGAVNGIRKCFHDTNDYSNEYIIKYMAEIQNEEFARYNLRFQSLWGRPLQLIDCQNIFCEVDKYSRATFPSESDNRKRIKQLFVNHGSINYFFPPKWKINIL